MLRCKHRFLPLLAALLVVAGSCTNDTLDDGDSPDVILEIEVLENPAVQASLDQMTGICTFTVTEWSFGASAQPKNRLAQGPFNDISMIRVTIAYDWIDPALSTPTRVVGLGGIIIPANATASLSFTPIAFDDLGIANAGRTSNLTLTFEAQTVEGTRLSTTVFRQLNVEGCA